MSTPLCHHVVSDFDLNSLSETADNHRFETEIGNLDS